MELIGRMGDLIGEMASSGAYLAGEGLAPTSQGVRVQFTKGKRTVTRGPFVGSNGLVASFAMIRVNSLDEAIECASRIGQVLGDANLYVGRVKEPWDIGLMPKPKGHAAARYLILRKSEARSEAGETDALVGLRPVARDKHTAIDGPFTESKELIAGYCILRVASREEAIAWATKFGECLCPYVPVDSVEVDVRELAEGGGFA